MTADELLKDGWKAKKITAASLSGLTCTVVAATKTVTRASGSWITDGISVGDIVTFTGFADSENNIDYTVASVSALSLTGTSAAAMKNVTADEGVAAAPLTKAVNMGPCKLGMLKVVTEVITVTPYNGTSAKWDAVASTAVLELQPCPIAIGTSLKLLFSADGSAWALYK
jgi:hypothetical protein